MKTFILTVLGLAALAQGQDLSTLPSCATSCAATAIGATGCAVTDAHCICTNSSFLAGVQTCISTACSPADQQKTLQFAVTYCLSGSVTITLPTAAPTTPVATSTVSAQAGGTTSGPAPTPAAVTSSVVVVSQITDGQPQAATSASIQTFKGAAPTGAGKNWVVEMIGLGVGVAAVL